MKNELMDLIAKRDELVEGLKATKVSIKMIEAMALATDTPLDKLEDELNQLKLYGELQEIAIREFERKIEKIA